MYCFVIPKFYQFSQFSFERWHAWPWYTFSITVSVQIDSVDISKYVYRKHVSLIIPRIYTLYNVCVYHEWFLLLLPVHSAIYLVCVTGYIDVWPCFHDWHTMTLILSKKCHFTFNLKNMCCWPCFRYWHTMSVYTFILSKIAIQFSKNVLLISKNTPNWKK